MSRRLYQFEAVIEPVPTAEAPTCVSPGICEKNSAKDA